MNVPIHCKLFNIQKLDLVSKQEFFRKIQILTPPGTKAATLTVNIVVFNEAATFSKNVHSSLLSVVNFIPSDGRVAIAGYPHASKIIRMNPIIDELTQSVFVNVNTAGLAVMYFTLHNCRVGSCFYFEPCNSVVVDVVGLKKSLQLSIK